MQGGALAAHPGWEVCEVPTLATRAAAYTRTGILRRFLDQLADAVPSRIDNAYAEGRLGLKGGDVRAFLQSVRVLGFADPYGLPTERAKRSRAVSQRPAVLRESLQQAYPELVRRWDRQRGMSREEIEDFFKVEYGLSASSASPAAKLFADLIHESARDGGRGVPAPVGLEPLERNDAAPEVDFSSPPRSDERRSEPAASAYTPPSDPLPEPTATPIPAHTDARVAALDAVRSAVHIQIDAQWDVERINLVFDRMDRLMDRILTSAPRSNSRG